MPTDYHVLGKLTKVEEDIAELHKNFNEKFTLISEWHKEILKEVEKLEKQIPKENPLTQHSILPHLTITSEVQNVRTSKKR